MTQQLDLRRIGCSDIPALLGLDPYRGKLDLWVRLVHEISPILPDRAMEAGRLGTAYERATATVYLEDHLRRPNSGLVQPPSRNLEGTGRDHLRYSLDFVVGYIEALGGRPPLYTEPGCATTVDPAIIECKVRNRRSFDRQGFTDDAPSAAVRAQVQAQMACIRLDEAWWTEAGAGDVPEVEGIHVVVSVDGQHLVPYWVERDPEQGAAMLEVARKFWRDFVVTQRPPKPDGTEAAGWALQALHPEDNGTELEAEEWAEEIAEEIAECDDAIQAATREREVHRQLLMEHMGSTRKLRGNGWSATWSHRRGRIDHRAVSAELAAKARVGPGELKRIEEKHRGEATRQLTVWRARR